MQLDKIFAAADLRRFGEFDYAVPLEWMLRDPDKHRPHVWFYPSTRTPCGNGRKPGNLCGRPLHWRAAGRLALVTLRRAGIPELDTWLRIWAFVHPGKGLDASGILAVKRFLADHRNDRLHGHIASIIGHYQIPPPPEGTFEEPLPLAA